MQGYGIIDTRVKTEMFFQSEKVCFRGIIIVATGHELQ